MPWFGHYDAHFCIVVVRPKKWNVHFLPQAIVCNLHQNIDRYTFVGNMGQEFMFEIERMANQFGAPLPDLLNASFGYVERVRAGEKDNIGEDKSGRATYAPWKVEQFYTAQTVRRGLELMSIDYSGIEGPRMGSADVERRCALSFFVCVRIIVPCATCCHAHTGRLKAKVQLPNV